MEFGVCIPNKIDETGIAAYAENLGYSHAWITDTQMIYSDCWATPALVAQQTCRIKVGPGVAIAPTRLAPVTANAIATINRLAPGRTFLVPKSAKGCSGQPLGITTLGPGSADLIPSYVEQWGRLRVLGSVRLPRGGRALEARSRQPI